MFQTPPLTHFWSFEVQTKDKNRIEHLNRTGLHGKKKAARNAAIRLLVTFVAGVDPHRAYCSIRGLDERGQYYRGRGFKAANRGRTLRLDRRSRELNGPRNDAVDRQCFRCLPKLYWPV